MLDVLGIGAAAYVALALRYEDLVGIDRLVGWLPIFVVLIAARVAVNVRFGLYSRRWRFASVPDLERIGVAVVVGSIVAAGFVVYGSSVWPGTAWARGFPRSFWLVEMLITGASWSAAYDSRSALHRIGRQRFAPVAITNRRATLFYGAGRYGVLMAGSARRRPNAGVVPVGFLDDDPSLAGGLVANLRVFGGLQALDRAIAATRAEALLITMPSATGKTIRAVVDAAMARGLDVRTVPSMNDLLDGTLDAYRIRRVQVEDLLRRTTGTEHAEAVHEIIRDRTVLITGAGGSIGSELARQVSRCAHDGWCSWIARRARSISSSANSRRSAVAIRVSGSFGPTSPTSRAARRWIVSSQAEKPDIIFHAAAYKHVPMMEEHPSDAVHVNIGGTMALLDAAVAAGVGRFVLVSTDKAVRPSSVMGASKRVAEMLVADAARRTGRPYVSVRFGNVLGSTGSVVPIFQEQLEKGEPLSITHPDMTRYFMTIPEASWLILDAAALGTNGDLFVLDMGEPIRIVDLARDLVRLAGRDPDTQPMDIVGLRPGEKLHEELFYDAEEVEPTSVPKVLRAIAEAPATSVREDARELLALATGAREDELRTALLAYTIGAAGQQQADSTNRHPRVSEPSRWTSATTVSRCRSSADHVVRA